jgi:hypothetical protein
LQKSLQYSHNVDSITPKLYALLTTCHRRLGQHEQAWTVCQAGQARCPDDAELLFLKGQLCQQRGDRATARWCWSQLLEPRSEPRSLTVAARTEENRSLTVAAQVDGVFRSVDAGLQGPLVRHHLAVLDRDKGKLADAETHWRDLLAETLAFVPARLGLAELYLRQERFPELEPLLGELEPQAPLDAALLRARTNDSASRQRRTTARHHLIALYRAWAATARPTPTNAPLPPEQPRQATPSQWLRRANAAARHDFVGRITNPSYAAANGGGVTRARRR